MHLNRVMIAAPKSGSGKTMLVTALLELWRLMGKNVFAVKTGPDYIDPLFHESVSGVPSFNLDTFFTDRMQTLELLSKAAADSEYGTCMMEGVMGLYDGIGGVCQEGSSYELAKWTKTPIILVIDAKGSARTLLAVVKGMLAMDEGHLIRGIILNRISENFFERIRTLIQEETGISVVGFLPERKELSIESRYLGLKLPRETDGIRERIRKAAEAICKTLNLDLLIRIAEKTEDITIVSDLRQAVKQKYRIAIAKDEAFCFYYRENLRLLSELGCKFVFFSPIHDKELPENINGMLLGGGYPELFAEKLSENESMKRAVKDAIDDNMPVIAECGGFLYLHEWLSDQNAREYSMCGVVQGRAYYGKRMNHFGYVSLEMQREEGNTFRGLKGHEFHRYDSTNPGRDLLAIKPYDGACYRTGHLQHAQYMGFVHMYLPSLPLFAKGFCKEVAHYAHTG